jgi:hypothetical protein
MNTNILAIGGSRKTGGRVVEQLQNKGIKLRIGSRNSSTSFDWDNKNTRVDALTDIEKMYTSYYPNRAVPRAKEDKNSSLELPKLYLI